MLPSELERQADAIVKLARASCAPLAHRVSAIVLRVHRLPTTYGKLADVAGRISSLVDLTGDFSRPKLSLGGFDLRR